MLRHPSQSELLAYVESLVDSGVPISAKTGAHVSACDSCQLAVRSIRASLEFASRAPELEPSKDLTTQILLAAQSERRVSKGSSASRRRLVLGALKGVGFAAALALISTLYFNVALHDASSRALGPATAQHPAVVAALPSAESIRKASAEVRVLAAAVTAPAGKPQGLWEREYLRQVQARNVDISRAVEALQQNPGCQRAGYFLNSNLQRQVETLRKLYIERSL